jgi:hypothetical protein
MFYIYQYINITFTKIASFWKICYHTSFVYLNVLLLWLHLTGPCSDYVTQDCTVLNAALRGVFCNDIMFIASRKLVICGWKAGWWFQKPRGKKKLCCEGHV